MKNNVEGYVEKSTGTFTAEEVNDFMVNAPDDMYLREKLAFGLGIYGRLRAMEYTYLFYSKNDKEKIKLLYS